MFKSGRCPLALRLRYPVCFRCKSKRGIARHDIPVLESKSHVQYDGRSHFVHTIISFSYKFIERALGLPVGDVSDLESYKNRACEYSD